MGRLEKAMAKNLSYDAGAKREFQLAAIQVLKKLRTELGLNSDFCDVRYNAGGIAVSGEATLHGEWIYVQVSQSPFSAGGRDVMFRSCRSRRDYTGGQNHWATVNDLEDVVTFARRLIAVKNAETVLAMRSQVQKSDDPLEN